MSKKTKKPRASKRSASAESSSVSVASNDMQTAERDPTTAGGSVAPTSAPAPSSFQSLIPKTDDIDDDWGADDAVSNATPISASMPPAKPEPVTSIAGPGAPAPAQPTAASAIAARSESGKDGKVTSVGASAKSAPAVGPGVVPTPISRPSSAPQRSLTPASGTPATRPSVARCHC